jgi:hypothetical protein
MAPVAKPASRSIAASVRSCGAMVDTRTPDFSPAGPIASSCDSGPAGSIRAPWLDTNFPVNSEAWDVSVHVPGAMARSYTSDSVAN